MESPGCQDRRRKYFEPQNVIDVWEVGLSLALNSDFTVESLHSTIHLQVQDLFLSIKVEGEAESSVKCSECRDGGCYTDGNWSWSRSEASSRL